MLYCIVSLQRESPLWIIYNRIMILIAPWYIHRKVNLKTLWFFHRWSYNRRLHINSFIIIYRFYRGAYFCLIFRSNSTHNMRNPEHTPLWTNSFNFLFVSFSSYKALFIIVNSILRRKKKLIFNLSVRRYWIGNKKMKNNFYVKLTKNKFCCWSHKPSPVALWT